MVSNARKQHWEGVYRSKDTTREVSWYQDYPKISVDLILATGVGRSGKIIDIGGGDSMLVDSLLKLGFGEVSVLDIAGEALRKVQARLGGKARLVTWIEANVLEFDTSMRFDVWHDRATFHFFTRAEEVARYVEIAGKLVRPGGHLVMATFSERGPRECSGLNIGRYSEGLMKKTFEPDFSWVKGVGEGHTTPFGTKQDFLFSVLRRN